MAETIEQEPFEFGGAFAELPEEQGTAPPEPKRQSLGAPSAWADPSIVTALDVPPWERGFMRPSEVGVYMRHRCGFGVGTLTVMRWIKGVTGRDGSVRQLAAFKVAGRWLVKVEEVDAFCGFKPKERQP